MGDFIARIIIGELFDKSHEVHFEKKDGKIKLKDSSVDNINNCINENVNKAFLNYSYFFDIPLDSVTMDMIIGSGKSIDFWIQG